jgi:hypothetical protein
VVDFRERCRLVRSICLLAGDVGDEIEVVVVVEQDEPGGFGRRSYEQGSDLRSALAASFGEAVPDAYRPIRYWLTHRYERPSDSSLPPGFMVSGARGRVATFEVRDRAAS